MVNASADDCTCCCVLLLLAHPLPLSACCCRVETAETGTLLHPLLVVSLPSEAVDAMDDELEFCCCCCDCCDCCRV